VIPLPIPGRLRPLADRMADLAWRAADVAAGRLGYHRDDREEDGPSTVGRSWTPAFAESVRAGDLIAVHADELARAHARGLRALRVAVVRESKLPAILFGGEHAVLVLLCVDVDSGEPHSLTVAMDWPVRVCPDLSRLDEQVTP
jgi:hypothetical protein